MVGVGLPSMAEIDNVVQVRAREVIQASKQLDDDPREGSRRTNCVPKRHVTLLELRSNSRGKPLFLALNLYLTYIFNS